MHILAGFCTHMVTELLTILLTISDPPSTNGCAGIRDLKVRFELVVIHAVYGDKSSEYLSLIL